MHVVRAYGGSVFIDELDLVNFCYFHCPLSLMGFLEREEPLRRVQLLHLSFG